MTSQGQCATSPANPCKKISDGACVLEKSLNQDFTYMVANKINYTCNCDPLLTGYTWVTWYNTLWINWTLVIINYCKIKFDQKYQRTKYVICQAFKFNKSYTVHNIVYNKYFVKCFVLNSLIQIRCIDYKYVIIWSAR